jgi:type VI secretion system protein VasG
VEKILSRTLLPELSAEVLSRLAEGATIDAVTVGVDTAGSFQYHIG